MGVHRPERGGRRPLLVSRRRDAPRSWWREAGLRAALVGSTVVLWIQTRWCAVPHRVCTHQNVTGDLAGLRDLVEGIACHMLRKSDAPKPLGLEPCVSHSDPMMSSHPALWSYLTQMAWEDGSPRETASLLVFMDGGAFKAMLRDKANGLCLWVAAPALSMLMDVLEAKLLDPNADWRTDRVAPGQKAGRVRKTS